MTILEAWDNFYLIVGGSAGALIGLQFVVITLIAELPLAGVDAKASDAFSTPSVVHFGIALLLSAIITAPWDGMGIVELLWAVVGLGGTVYALIVARRMKTQTAYRPVFEDWLFHLLLPLVSYAILVVSAFIARANPGRALFGVAGAAILLLFIGIHNAWDAVTYHVFVRSRQFEKDKK
jgi:hypothetical protein